VSENERPDPARTLIEGFQAMGRVISEWFIEGFQAMGRVISEWLEEWRPVIAAMAEVASRPEVRAAIERNRAWHPCHCLCARAHPADEGICEAGSAVTTRRFETELLGPVDVPLCAPCAVAQGLAELA
jgi:hypothetical protein